MIGTIIKLILMLFMAFVLFMIGFDFNYAMKTRYWINDGRNTYYTDSYIEKDNCIYFTSHYERPITMCGAYTISDRK